ncbi:hypothetical protein [Xenorhabdus bovienii]|uniref:hypothetical protein n=1 Tax=Xenorhabdus bovienii TaxID=40576 RepID=UPI00301E42B8
MKAVISLVPFDALLLHRIQVNDPRFLTRTAQTPLSQCHGRDLPTLTGNKARLVRA